MTFQFLDFDRLNGTEVDLLISEKTPENKDKEFVPAYKYKIVLHNTNTVVGKIDIRIGYQESLYYGGHIGYTVFEDSRGHHFAGKACILLRQVALEHGMNCVRALANNWFVMQSKPHVLWHTKQLNLEQGMLGSGNWHCIRSVDFVS